MTQKSTRSGEPGSDRGRECVRHARPSGDHDAFLRHKVAAARVSVREGRGRSHDAVEAGVAARRARIIDGA